MVTVQMYFGCGLPLSITCLMFKCCCVLNKRRIRILCSLCFIVFIRGSPPNLRPWLFFSWEMVEGLLRVREEIKYLEVRIRKEGRMEREVDGRIDAASMREPSREAKLQVCRSTFLPPLTCGREL